MPYPKHNNLPPQTTNFEIQDVEEYRSEQDLVFSHQALVMRAMNKCIELGSKELIEGFYDEGVIDKHGVPKIIYKEDTRRAFIEAIKTAKMVMICDFDKEAKDKVKKIKDKLEKLFVDCVQEQKEWYNRAPEEFKRKNPIDLRYLNPNFQMFWNEYIDRQLDIYREMFEELSLLTSRIDFYKGKEYEA